LRQQALVRLARGRLQHRPDPNTPVEETVRAMSGMRHPRQGTVLGHQQVVGAGGRAGAARIRASEWGGKMLPIALTGWGQAQDQARAGAAGFDHHITKPLELDTLLEPLAPGHAHAPGGARRCNIQRPSFTVLHPAITWEPSSHATMRALEGTRLQAHRSAASQEKPLNRKLQVVLAACGLAMATHAAAQITLYGREDFQGRSFQPEERVRNLERYGFNNRASSAVVERGRWQVCEGPRFEGRCVVLRRGSYPSLREMGLNNAVSSVRRIEREQVAQPAYGQPNVGGAVIGGVVGGLLGHQVGGGSGKSAATIGGAIAGAAIGSQVGGGSAVAGQRDVQKCQQVVNTQPAYWDVTYVHAGVQHRVQLAQAPGPTIPLDAATGAPLVAGR
jgi:uncharacterized protein YcfJ